MEFNGGGQRDGVYIAFFCGGRPACEGVTEVVLNFPCSVEERMDAKDAAELAHG